MKIWVCLRLCDSTTREGLHSDCLYLRAVCFKKWVTNVKATARWQAGVSTGPVRGVHMYSIIYVNVRKKRKKAVEQYTFYTVEKVYHAPCDIHT